MECLDLIRICIQFEFLDIEKMSIHFFERLTAQVDAKKSGCLLELGELC